MSHGWHGIAFLSFTYATLSTWSNLFQELHFFIKSPTKKKTVFFTASAQNTAMKGFRGSWLLLQHVHWHQLSFHHFRLNDFSDSTQNSRVYTSSNGAARIGGRQGNSRTLSDSDSQDKRSRIGFTRSSMQATSSQLAKGSSASGQEGPPAACQLTNRKARSTKQLDLLHGQSLAGSLLPHRGLGPEDAEYANLIGAMDNDLDRPESINAETLQEQSSQSIQNKGTHVCFDQRESRRPL